MRISLSLLLGVVLFASPMAPLAEENLSLDAPPGYQEIPYYLRKLKETKEEGKILEYNKKIHDAIVHADLSSKKVIKKMEPILEEVMIAMDSGLDRPNLTGDNRWLASAVNYFDQEKGRPLIHIPKSEWMELQSKSENYSISTYPDKILLHSKRKSIHMIESSFIHEAVISPDESKVAFFRVPNEGVGEAEIWTIRIKDLKAERIATVPSCYSLLFSMRGKKIFYQEKPTNPGVESAVGSVSSRGGTPRIFTSGILLDTLVKEGRYKGAVIVYRNSLHHLGGANYQCPYVFKPSGKELGRLRDGPCR